MLCPMMSYQAGSSGGGQKDCKIHDCAWYCPDSQMCAIKKIALQDAITLTPATTPRLDEVMIQYLNNAT